MKKVATVIGVTALLISLTACGSSNTDPQKGSVNITMMVYKVCDGANLIYARRGGGVAVILNSAECSK